jgi:hypothetical protein
MVVAAVLAIPLLVHPGLCAAQEMDVPLDLQAKLLPKILRYNHSLKAARSGEFLIGIAHQASYRTSLEVKNDLMNRHMDEIVDGLPIRFVSLPVESEATLEAALADTPLDAIYIAPLRAVDIGAVARICRGRRLISFSGIAAYTRLGLCVGFGMRGGKPQMHINLPAARAVGAEFSSRLLEICKVIK